MRAKWNSSFLFLLCFRCSFFRDAFFDEDGRGTLKGITSRFYPSKHRRGRGGGESRLENVREFCTGICVVQFSVFVALICLRCVCSFPFSPSPTLKKSIIYPLAMSYDSRASKGRECCDSGRVEWNWISMKSSGDNKARNRYHVTSFMHENQIKFSARLNSLCTSSLCPVLGRLFTRDYRFGIRRWCLMNIPSEEESRTRKRQLRDARE